MKSKKIDSNGLKFNIWFYFIIFSLLIIALLWFFQIVFLNTTYTRMKAKEVQNIGEDLLRHINEPSFADKMQDTAMKNSAVVVLFDEATQIIHYANMFEGADQPPAEVDIFKDFFRSLSKSESGKICYTERYQGNSTAIIYGARVMSAKGNMYLYFNSPLEPVGTTTSVLTNQLTMVTLIALILAFVLSWYISSQLSRPIVQMSESAKQLAKGNYDIRFEGNGYTEIDKLSDTLNYVTEELSKTDKLRQELIANISHDLRTPLTLIKSYAEMIRDLSGDDKNKREKHLQLIVTETDRLASLVNDLLVLSKIQANGDELKIEPFDLSKMVKEVVEHFEILVTSQNYNLKLDVGENLIAIGDIKKIEQVIYNLISNAVNYTGENKKVFIKLLITEQNKIRFEVTDSGKGIPKKDIDQIWDRYYRAVDSHKRSTVGTGLGLNIVKNILSSHNAVFGVESEVNKGSTFYFELNMGTKL